MSIKRSRTKTKAGEKIQCNLEYGLDEILFYISYGDKLYIRLKDTSGLSEYMVASKLLKLYYKLLDSEIDSIEKTLKIKINGDKITDKNGNRINLILL